MGVEIERRFVTALGASTKTVKSFCGSWMSFWGQTQVFS